MRDDIQSILDFYKADIAHNPTIFFFTRDQHLPRHV